MEKNLSQSLFLLKLQIFYPVILLKEKDPIQMFSDEFARYLKHLFYRTPLGDCVCSTEKYLQVLCSVKKGILENGCL